jgi:glycosyltransferase involved in cell wall biosynthesis
LTNGEKTELIPRKVRRRTKSDLLVSVVLPTYNRAGLLTRAIESVLQQTYSNFELIVVDDCSTDCTEDVVKEFQDNRIRYIRHEKNRGAPIARNNGIRAAKGNYIAFQDSDDVWVSTKLEKQVNAFNSASNDLGVVYTSFWLIDYSKETLVPSSHVKKAEGKIHDVLLEMNLVSLSSAIVRKECFEKVGMFADIPRFQDWELWLRISKYYVFKHLNEPLVKVYRQPDSISRNTNAFVTARKYILSKFFDEISKKPKLLSKHYSDIGTLLCLEGDIKEGRKYFFKALSAHPFNVKLLLWTIASIFGPTTYKNYSTFYNILKNSRNLKK